MKEEGRDWDKLLPYVLFTYREIPQASTGCSPFELLYGRPVRGLLNVLREKWEAQTKSSESVVSHILHIRERMEKMSEIVQENVSRARERQKRWYDKNAHTWRLKRGDHVLVLLPTPTNKLMAQWQGPYSIVQPTGSVNYKVDMHDKRKRYRTFHINMHRKWHSSATACFVDERGRWK